MFSAGRLLRYSITDRRALGGTAALLRNVERLGATIDFLQIREKDLTARELAALTRAVLGVAGAGVRVLVNDRADVAVACGAHGVHLRGDGIAPRLLRRVVPAGFVISLSCHSAEDVIRAEAEGADLALLAPVFETPGKGAAIGLERFEAAARSVGIPVLALGGVTELDVGRCAGAGAAGVAGIRLFQS